MEKTAISLEFENLNIQSMTKTFFDLFPNSGIFVELIVINIYFPACGKRVHLRKTMNTCVKSLRYAMVAFFYTRISATLVTTRSNYNPEWQNLFAFFSLKISSEK